MNVAVVILNWNGKHLLEQFLPSVIEHREGAALYVADNNSSDGSVAYLQQNFPDIKVIKNQVNGGYAKGYNDALKQLNEDIFVLLNSDVQVMKGWISSMLPTFENYEDCVAAQPKIIDFSNPEYFEYAGAGGGFIDSLGYPYCRGRIFNSIEKDDRQYDDIQQIFWASGACLFVKRTAFENAGGFDEDFFAHQEEIDLCWRLQKQGGKIYYNGNSKIYHLGGGTLEASHPRKTFYNFRNTLLMLYKNVSGSRIYGLIFMRLILDGMAAMMFLFQGKGSHFLAVLRSHFSFYGLLGKFRKKRKEWSNSLQYADIKSVVFKYFILKKRTFKEL